jgi:hypothetical protein
MPTLVTPASSLLSSSERSVASSLSMPRHPRAHGLTSTWSAPRARPRRLERRHLSASSSLALPVAPRHPYAASPYPRRRCRHHHPRPSDRRAEEKEGGATAAEPFAITEPLPEPETTPHSSTLTQQLAIAPQSYPPQAPR